MQIDCNLVEIESSKDLLRAWAEPINLNRINLNRINLNRINLNLD